MFCKLAIPSLSSTLRTKTILLVKSSLLSLCSWQRHPATLVTNEMREDLGCQATTQTWCLSSQRAETGRKVWRSLAEPTKVLVSPRRHPAPTPSTIQTLSPTPKKKKNTHTHPPTFHSLCLSRQSLWTEPVGTVTSFSSSVEPAVVVPLPLCGADTSCGRWGMQSPAPPLKVCTQRWENTISIPLGKLCF